MKLKIEKDRKGRTERFVVRTTKGEELVYAQAEWLKTNEDKGLLPFAYEAGRKGDACFFYDITDMIPLETYLKAQLARTQFRMMLDNVIAAMETCSAFGLDPSLLIFDPPCVRLDANSNKILFAYVPINKLTGTYTSVVDLLVFLAKQASFVCAEDGEDAALLLDHLRRQTVFSVVDFKVFLESTAFRKETKETQGTASFASGGLSPDSGAWKAPESMEPAKISSLSSGISSGGTSDGQEPDTVEENPKRVTYDFVGNQVGVLSTQETRARQTLAEQVASDVADTPPKSFAAGRKFRAIDEVVPDSSTTLLGGGPSFLGGTPTPSCSDTPSPPFIVVHSAEGKRFPVDACATMTIGRSKQCDISISGNRNISRTHATITTKDGSCFLTDEGSTNKTFIEGIALTPHKATEILRGSSFRLADEKFLLE